MLPGFRWLFSYETVAKTPELSGVIPSAEGGGKRPSFEEDPSVFVV
jgi:hypothetical protein